MEQEEHEAGESLQYLTFDLGGDRYAVPVASVEVVLEEAVITRVPKSPIYLRGVINHRGSVIPVVELRSVFGLSSAEDADSQSFIVVQAQFEEETLTAGLLADQVHEVVELESAAIESTPRVGSSAIDDSFIAGIGKRDDRFIIILDLEKALAMSAVQPVAD